MPASSAAVTDDQLEQRFGDGEIPADACSLQDLVLHGASSAIRDLREHIGTAARQHCPVLLRGSIADGAAVVARSIHLRSASRSRPFVPIDCGLRFASEIEAVLFGAAGVDAALAIPRATVVLQNIEDLSFDLQTRLAAALQDSQQSSPYTAPGGARVIATSAVDLPTAGAKRAFNRKLMLLLNAFSIRVPLLPERREDIPGIAQIIIDSCGRPSIGGLTAHATIALQNYRWRDIDQLRNCLQFAVARAQGPDLDVCDLPREVAVVSTNGSGASRHTLGSRHGHESAVLPMSELERLAIIEALRSTNGDKHKAAEILGIGRSTLYRRVKRFGLE